MIEVPEDFLLRPLRFPCHSSGGETGLEFSGFTVESLGEKEAADDFRSDKSTLSVVIALVVDPPAL